MVYFIVLLFMLISVYRYDYRNQKKSKWAWYYLIMIMLVCIAGFRYNLGIDTLRYEKWFESYVDAHIAGTDAELYKAVDDLKRQKRRATPKVTVKEEFEARRHMEALRAYQERVMKDE
jgi:hypothetical protein